MQQWVPGGSSAKVADFPSVACVKEVVGKKASCSSPAEWCELPRLFADVLLSLQKRSLDLYVSFV